MTITIINTPAIYSCFLTNRNTWVNLADIRVIQQEPGTTRLTITWRNGESSIIGGNDATFLLDQWRTASAKVPQDLEDKAYFLMNKLDYSLQVIALGTATRELVKLVPNTDFESSLTSIRWITNKEVGKLKHPDISHIYTQDRDTSQNKILAAIVECNGNNNFLRVM